MTDDFANMKVRNSEQVSEKELKKMMLTEEELAEMERETVNVQVGGKSLQIPF